MLKQSLKKPALMALPLAAAILCGGAALAGARGKTEGDKAASSRPKTARIFERLQRELKLTPAQQTKVRSIVEEAIPQGIAVHDDMDLKPAEKRKRLQAIRMATRDRIAAELTDEQKAKLHSMRNGAAKQVRGRLEGIAAELEMTDAQKEQSRPILRKAFRRAVDVHEDMSLTLAQKLVKWRQIQTDTRSEFSKILTPEQLEKADAIVADVRSEVWSFVRAKRKAITQ